MEWVIFSTASSIGWGVGVHRVDAPLVAGAVVRRLLDAVRSPGRAC